MAESTEQVKFVNRGGVNVLTDDLGEHKNSSTQTSQKKGRAKVAGSRRAREPSFLWRHPQLQAIMTVLGMGVGAYFLPNNPSSLVSAETGEGNTETLSSAQLPQQEETIPGYSLPAPFEEAYGSLLPGEKEDAFSELRRRMGSLSLTDEQIADIARYEPMIRKAAKDANIPDNLFLGLVITESRGKPRAVSSAGAKGLTQMMVPIAEKYGLATTDISEEDSMDTDERLDPEKILPDSAAELRSYYDKFGDWSLAFWAWHAGEPAVYRAIQIYADSPGGGGIRLPDIQSAADLIDGLATFGYYQNYIKDKRINAFRLFQNDDVQEYFADTANSDWDRTRIYVELNAEWAMLWDELVASGLNLNPALGEVSQQ